MTRLLVALTEEEAQRIEKALPWLSYAQRERVIIDADTAKLRSQMSFNSKIDIMPFLKLFLFESQLFEGQENSGNYGQRLRVAAASQKLLAAHLLRYEEMEDLGLALKNMPGRGDYEPRMAAPTNQFDAAIFWRDEKYPLKKLIEETFFNKKNIINPDPDNPP